METYALITGGAGFIGSHIAINLLQTKKVGKVVLLDNLSSFVNTTNPGYVDYRKYRLKGYESDIILERGDTKYFSVVSEILEKYQPKLVFHMAALPLAKIQNLNSEEAKSGSVDSTSFLIEKLGQMRKKPGFNTERFVYASSSMVYGNLNGEFFAEGSNTEPVEIYGTMKLAGEIVTRGLANFYDIPFTIIRPSAVYGPTDMNRRVVQIFIEKAIKGETIDVQGADERLDFTNVRDVARGFVEAATNANAVGETFNITNGNSRTLLELAECIKSHFPQVKINVSERDSFRPRRGTLSTEKARLKIGYEPTYTLEEGISEYVKFLTNIQNNQ